MPLSILFQAATIDELAALIRADGNGAAVLSKAIPFTDFPLDEIKFYVTNSTILLPSEY